MTELGSRWWSDMPFKKVALLMRYWSSVVDVEFSL